MKKNFYASGYILVGGFLIAVAVFVFSQKSTIFLVQAQTINSPTQWTQESGNSISVPACVSSGSTANPITCQNGAPLVQFSFSDLQSHLNTIRLQIFRNDVMVVEQILCGDSRNNALQASCPSASYTWTGGQNNQAYTWRLIHAFAGQVVPETDPGGSGSFTTPNCTPSPTPRLPDLVPHSPSIQ